jgi:hypothetical protein
MAINSKDRFATLPEARQKAILARADKLVAKEMTLAELREARECSQVELADRLGIKQAAVSRLERRVDMYVSSMRHIVEAMGGTLEITARFPNRAPVRLKQFKTLHKV